jgi:hypothetical protein
VADCEELNMDMDLTKFWFFVIPGWFGFLGMVFLMVFGNDLLRLYRQQRVNQKTREPWKTCSPIVEETDRRARHAPQRRKVEELVETH